MWKAGCGIMVVGVVAVIASVAMFGLSIFRASEANVAFKTPLTVGTKQTTEVFNVKTDKACMVAVKMDIVSHAMKDKEDQFDSTKHEYELKYKFPVRYRVLDAQGNELFAEETAAQWNSGTRISSGTTASATEGSANIRHDFDKFDVKSPGQIRVEVKCDRDDMYGAKASNVELLVYDNVSRHTGTILSGVSLVCLAPILVFVGLVIFIIGLATRKKKVA